MKPMITCASCGRCRRHVARGLCGACYKRLGRSGERPPPRRPIGGSCSIEGCAASTHARSLCATHFMREWRHGDASHESVKVRNREAAKAMLAHCRSAEAFDSGECWPWPGALRPNGYGAHRAHGTGLAHRAVWIEVFGPIQPRDLGVLHRCDNPPCVRPSHLFLGTDADNVADMMAKGREARNYGDDHHHIKLTDAQIAEIRALREQGLYLRTIAERYGVDPSHVGKICRGKARTIPASEREVDKIHAAGLSGAA